jgi:ABC-2 type transport system ATP-binding protein
MSLEQIGDRLAGQLSGGMKQKLALCCALISQPRLLLLDEPTTGVDPVARREFWDVLAALADDGITIVVATPYLDEAERCHRIALMYAGQINEIGTLSQLRAHLGLQRLEVRTGAVAGGRSIIGNCADSSEYCGCANFWRSLGCAGSECCQRSKGGAAGFERKFSCRSIAFKPAKPRSKMYL